MWNPSSDCLNPPKGTAESNLHVDRHDIDAFEAVMMREERMLGYFVGFEYTGDALFEIDRFRRKEGRRDLTADSRREILEEEVKS